MATGWVLLCLYVCVAVCVSVCVYIYLRLMMKTAADISSKIPTPLTESSRKAELTPSPIRGKGSKEEGHRSHQPKSDSCFF